MSESTFEILLDTLVIFVGSFIPDPFIKQVLLSKTSVTTYNLFEDTMLHDLEVNGDASFNQNVDIEKHFDTVIEVNTTYIASEAGHPRVYYKIKPEKGYVVCNYTNTCFKLSQNADLKTKEFE